MSQPKRDAPDKVPDNRNMTNPPVGENAAGLLTERGEAHAASVSRSRSRRRGQNVPNVTLACGKIKPISDDYPNVKLALDPHTQRTWESKIHPRLQETLKHAIEDNSTLECVLASTRVDKIM